MSYFDHVKCPSCQASFDPERLEGGPDGPRCPRCKSTLRLENLFGLKDEFRDDDEDGNNVSLDDLVGGGGRGGPSRGGDDEPRRPLSLDNLLPGPGAPPRRR
jgi:hypothetical protein